MDNESISVRRKISTNTVWEKVAGFSRALRINNNIFIAGTTATGPNGIIGKNDPAKQMYYILDTIESVIKELGGTLNDVVRTRIYVENINDWKTVAKIHGERFGDIKPVNTLIQSKLVGDCLVEVEAEAIVVE